MQSTEPEIWKPIPGWDGYQASSSGRILHCRLGRPMSPGANGTGYLKVTLRSPDRVAQIYVHQLVARAFHGEPGPGQEVRHRNADRSDNRAENLEWGTRGENMHDAVAHGNHFQARKTHCPQGHEYTPENTYRAPGRTNRSCLTCIRARDARKAARRQKKE